MTVDLHLFTEPQQGATYGDLLAVARAAEDLGFSGFFRSDHYLAMGGDGGAGPTDAWTTLAGLARETSTIRLGTLVTSATFRLPGPLAIQVAGVDQMSGGRVELGLGAGWFEAEHTAYGIPFPPLGERFDRLEEQLAVITGLWTTEAGKTFSHKGTHYPVVDSPALAKPVQAGGVPIIIGGGGKRRTPALAVRYAAEFNAPFVSATDAGRLFERVRGVAREAGREPGSLRCSAAQVVCVGSDDATLRRRAGAIGRDLDELRDNGLAGSPDEVVEKLAAFEAVGAERVYLQVLDLSDLDHLSDVADGVLRQLT
ncbi:LLM class F420-dependent oxidoreductase [Terrabacter sp. LjRoot27]|uniref:LLM class F420-dependent oxidoreductase n=1 Tax=Terrabacter sp. LjRoot27 TaxID=3342306 RepID=UPI003ECE8E99